ncbi:uncharacterized protein SOCEGT47_020920 [Sorangium cellulosum]|jgi:hypothetical protein|uniref:Zinc ribbon domain-containing protein n=1 Tax=Sorangium cellulosum TaxID=56 RepID=A0A4P2PYF1_SORCE|nr:hypothetical protein [Sorangium cellulosum]AUX21606.1 uncharacterized protein SOCEGT47_020920 [Sorangium cellulosum]
MSSSPHPVHPSSGPSGPYRGPGAEAAPGCARCGTRNDADAVFCKKCCARQVLQLGPIEFTCARMVVLCGGRVVSWAPRSAISSMEIEIGSEAVHPSATLGGGLMVFLAGLCFVGTPTPPGLLFGVLLLLSAVLTLGGAVYTRAAVRVRGVGTTSVIRVGAALEPERLGELRRELRDELGYPVE